jgi:hypothetical protein
MTKRLPIIVFLCAVITLSAGAQTPPTIVNVCPYAQHAKALACLIPDLTQTGQSQNLARFNTTVAQVLGQLPLAAPVSGFVLGFDKKLGIPIEENQNLGSVLTERGNTVGRHKVFVGFTYQRFVFQTIDGNKLSHLPSAYFIQNVPGTSTKEFGISTNSLGANLSQYTGIVAFGLTDRIDISLTVPYERVSLSAGNSNVQQAFVAAGGTTTVSAVQNGQAVAGAAHGFGDLLFNMKGTVFNGEKSKLALGLEARFPTGDEFNLLGTGAYGVKPYVVFSRLGRITPHVNVGYQWNDFSDLYINKCHFDLTCTANSSSLPTLRLPDSIDYSAGADVGIVKRLTFVGDFVGQHYFNAPRVTAAVPSSTVLPFLPIPNPSGSSDITRFNNSTTVGVNTGSIDVNNVALGLKVNPVGRLIVSVNALIRLDSGGLRPDRFVPLVGVSYRF